MGSFFAKYKMIIIAVAVILVVFIAYGILKKPSETAGTVSITTASGQPNGTLPRPGGAPGDEFIVQLLAIQNINFHTDFFNDPVYKELKDQARPLGDRPIGRPNPFYPIGIDPGQVVDTTGTGAGFTLTGAATNTATSARSTAATSSRSTTTPRR